MDDFVARMDLRASLEMYLFLAARENELRDGAAGFYAALRKYLYDRLSIEEMECPEAFLEALERIDRGDR